MNIGTYLRWLIVTIFIVYSWIGLHELSHSIVCKSIGGEPSLATILPHPSVKCENIVNEEGLIVNPIQYFILNIIPYILGLIAVVIMYFKKIHVKWVYILVSFILLSTVWNYIGALFNPTDFRNIFDISKPLFIVASFIAMLIVGFSVITLKQRFKEFKEYVQKVRRRSITMLAVK